MPATLDEPNRTRLDDIVGRMEAAGESEDDIRFVVSDFQSKYAQPEAATPPAPVSQPASGFFGQSAQKLATGTRQAIAGAKTTIGAALGRDSMTGSGLASLATADTRAQAERTPADIALSQEMQANAAEFDAAKGFWNKAGEFTDYAGIVARNPLATVQMGLQSLPNALISIPAAVAGRAAGAMTGAAAGIQTGPGAIATGIGGALAGDVAANTLMEAGPAIYDNIIEATGGAARNWTPEQFSAYAKANPDLVNRGLKSGALRGGVIGTVDALSMGLAGKMLAPAAASTATKAVRAAGATGVEVASEGLGEGLAGYADTGKIDSQAIVQEMAGGIGSGIPTAMAGRAMTSFKTQQPGESQTATTSDPLAAFAATMPTRSEDIPVRTATPEAGMSARAPVNAPSIESGMFDAQAMEGDILRDFNIQPDVATRVAQAEQDGAAWDAEQAARQAAYNQQFPILPEEQRAQLDDIVTRMEAAGESEATIRATVADFQAQPPATNPQPLLQQASVTPEASPVPIPAAPASAPVATIKDSLTVQADAGSTPAAGIIQRQGEEETRRQGETSPSPSTPPPLFPSSSPAPAFGSAAPVGTTRRVPVIPDAPYGGADVLDYLNDNTIAVPREILDVINQKKGAQLPASRKGDFNWLEKYEMPKAWRKYFFTENEGDQTSNINEVAQRAHEDGLISDPTPDALMGAVLDQIAARESYTRDVDAREKQLAAEEKALLAREKAESKRQQSWADDVINGSMETPFIGIDPKLMAAYTVKGAQLIKEGFTTFAKWSAEMISRFGEKVKDYLQGAWQAAMKTSEQGFLAGPRAFMSEERKRSLETAKAMAAAGKTSEEIRAITGWFPGKYDGKLRWEGSDENAKFKDTFESLQNGDHPPGKIRSVSYRKNGKRWDLELVPENAQRVSDIIHLKNVDSSVVRAVVSGDVWADIQANKGADDLMGSKMELEAKLLRKPFEFDGFNALPLSDVLDHPELFAAYPQAKEVFVKVDPTLNYGGSFSVLETGERVITVGKYKQMTTLVHEIQHWIQEQEGFAAGSNAEMFPDDQTASDAHVISRKLAEGMMPSDAARWFKDNLGRNASHQAMVLAMEPETKRSSLMAGPKQAYRRTAGEIESRDVQARQNFTDEQRAAIAPYSSENIAPEDAIVMFGTTGPQMDVDPNQPDEIKLTHEAERARMEAEGKGPLPTGGQGTVDEWQAEAAARVQQPGAAAAVVSEILAQQRPATPVEHYMLMNYAAALDADLAQANATLADPAAAPDARAAAAARKTTQDAERDRVAVAQQIAGSKAGAALGARSRGLDRGTVPSLAQMVADITLIQDPTGRTPLPPEERAVIEKTHAKMVEAEQALEKQREEGKGGAQETFNSELQRLLDEAKAEIAEHQAIIETQREILKDKGAPVKLYTKSKAKLQEWSEAGDAAMQRLRDKGFFAQANMGVDVSVIGDLAEVLRGWMSKGVLNTASLTAKLMTTMGEKNFMQVKKFLPQIFDKADQLAREGAKKKTPEEILAKGRKAAAANEGKLPRSLARQLALAHIVDHIERGDKTLSAAKIADLVRADLEEFQPGITAREARDLISGYGQATFPSKDEARAELRNLGAQMQKITQLEALRNKERLLKSGPQRDKPSAELRELQKQVEELKKEIGYEARSKEDELKSARDRIKTHLENQIEELQRVLAGKARPANPREAVVYDAELNVLKDLRGSLRDLVAEMPEHKLASEARRNKAALKSAQKSEAEWNRRAKAMQWKRPGKPPAAVSAEVDAARAKAKEARANFEALRKAADPRNDPEAKALRDFKRRTQKSIDDINTKIRAGDFDPPKKTPRQIKHDQESEKLRHDLEMKRREWIDLKLQHEWDVMSMPRRAIERLLRLQITARSIMTGGEFSGLLRQGMFKTVSHPIRVFGKDVPAMFKAFFSEQGETSVMNEIAMRPNSINGRYKTAKLAIHNPTDYSALMAEGNARSKFANKIPFIAGTGRAYTALLNHMRADLFDMMVEKIASKGTEPSDLQLKAIADFVNDSTGAGKLGIGPLEIKNAGAKRGLAAIFFSPSFLASRIRMLLGASLFSGDMRTRQLIAGEYLRITAGMAAVYALVSALAGHKDDDDENMDPRSSTFLKIKAGLNSSIDIMAGLSQIAVLFAREWMGQMVRNGKVYTLKPTEGGPLPYGQQDMGDVLGKFIRSKLSPGAGFAWNRLTGTDFSGKPTTLAQDVRTQLVPMTGGQIYDLWKHEKPQVAAPLSAAAMFGIGVNTYPPKR